MRQFLILPINDKGCQLLHQSRLQYVQDIALEKSLKIDRHILVYSLHQRHDMEMCSLSDHVANVGNARILQNNRSADQDETIEMELILCEIIS